MILLPFGVILPSLLNISFCLISAFLSFISNKLNIKIISRYVLYIGVAVRAQNFIPSEYLRIFLR